MALILTWIGLLDWGGSILCAYLNERWAQFKGWVERVLWMAAVLFFLLDVAVKALSWLRPRQPDSEQTRPQPSTVRLPSSEKHAA